MMAPFVIGVHAKKVTLAKEKRYSCKRPIIAFCDSKTGFQRLDSMASTRCMSTHKSVSFVSISAKLAICAVAWSISFLFKFSRMDALMIFLGIPRFGAVQLHLVWIRA